MKFMVLLLPLVLCLVRADSSDKQDVKTKMTSSTHNTIPPVKSHEVYYQNMLKYHQQQQPLQQQQIHQQQQLYQKPQYIPVQLIPRPYYVQPTHVQPHHHHPQAMIIIAQPALVPQSLFYGAQQPAASPTQQLLNYFHSNPQAKYQLLHGNTQQLQQVQPHHQVQQAQPSYTHQVIGATSYGNYIVAAPPHYHQPNLVAQAAATVPVHAVPHSAAIAAQYQVQPQYQIQPQLQAVHHLPQHQVVQQQIVQQQAPQVAQHQVPQHQVAQQQQQQQPQQLRSIAHLAQLAAQQFHSSTAAQKSAPSAIVTGFEQFSPQQQAQIKAQLSNHLGANYHAVTAGNGNNQYSAKYQASEEQQAQGEQEEEEFVPSPQVKTTAMEHVVVSGGSAAGGDILKTRYTTKGIRM